MNMMTSIRKKGDITIVDISGKIALGEESATLRNTVMDLLGEGNTKILLNLADVDYMDSSGLGALVGAAASARKQGGEVKLMKLSSKVNNLLQITKLYTVFDIAESEAAAVKSFGQQTAAKA